MLVIFMVVLCFGISKTNSYHVVNDFDENGQIPKPNFVCAGSLTAVAAVCLHTQAGADQPIWVKFTSNGDKERLTTNTSGKERQTYKSLTQDGGREFYLLVDYPKIDNDGDRYACFAPDLPEELYDILEGPTTILRVVPKERCNYQFFATTLGTITASTTKSATTANTTSRATTASTTSTPTTASTTKRATAASTMRTPTTKSTTRTPTTESATRTPKTASATRTPTTASTTRRASTTKTTTTERKTTLLTSSKTSEKPSTTFVVNDEGTKNSGPLKIVTTVMVLDGKSDMRDQLGNHNAGNASSGKAFVVAVVFICILCLIVLILLLYNWRNKQRSLKHVPVPADDPESNSMSADSTEVTEGKDGLVENGVV